MTELLSLSRQSITNASNKSSLLDQIQTNFTAAADRLSANVGGLHWVDSLHFHVAFFLLSDVTDPDLTVRSRLPSGPQVHPCDDMTQFTQTHFGRASPTAFERDREFWNLSGFLSTLSYKPVHTFPSEHLLCMDSAISVCERLRNHLLATGGATGTADTAATLVFLRRTNLAVHSELVRRAFSYAQDKLLTRRHSVYIVTDVGQGVLLPSLEGVLRPSSSHVHTTVYSGAKPNFSPISCVIIALHMSWTG